MDKTKAISKSGTGRIKRFLIWLFLGKKIRLSDDQILICPRCMAKMDKMIHYGVTIDTCASCGGLWLDDGEIDQLNQLARKTVVASQGKRHQKKSIKSK